MSSNRDDQAHPGTYWMPAWRREENRSSQRLKVFAQRRPRPERQRTAVKDAMRDAGGDRAAAISKVLRYLDEEDKRGPD